MTRRLAGTALAALLAGCTSADPDPRVEFLPKDLDLPPSAWSDRDTRWMAVSVLNQSWFPVDLTEVQLVGSGASFLEVDTVADARVIGVGESASIRVRIRPASQNDAARWSSGTFSASLRFNIGGTGSIDPNTQERSETAYVVHPYEVPVRFRLVCDLDGDGFDALACSGGSDCDDRLEAVNPAADEVCDGFDNNCDGRVDEHCT